MLNSISEFERFILDGGVNSPDLYFSRELEDFSPEASVNVAFINSFANVSSKHLALDKIA